jgi:hypothetical protein
MRTPAPNPLNRTSQSQVMDESSNAGEDRPDTEPTVRSAAPPSAKPGWMTILRRRWKTVALAAAVLAALTGLIAQRLRQDAAHAARVAAQQAADEDNKISRPIDPFLFGAFTLRPSETDRVESGLKPGHWTTGTLEARANFDDFRGDLVTEMVPLGGESADPTHRDSVLHSSRPAILPKMQKKLLDLAVYTPVLAPQRQLATKLQSPGGRDVWNARELLTLLPAEQFYLTVLTADVDDYRYLHSLDSIWAPRGSLDDRGAQAHYRVLLPKVTAAAPLPDQALYWTNTAVVLWDGFDPKLLSASQQQAMLDWLHWGGQLIVSGPGSLEMLRDSFLDAALPATAGESWELHEETLAPLARVSPDPSKALRITQPWTGQHLNTSRRDAFVLVETGDHEPLIVERQVGRGRTVVTAFRLSQRGLIDWPNYDALFNSVLLRRASRRFVASLENRVGVAWADGVVEDSSRVSRLRFFSRDAGRPEVPKPTTENSPWTHGLPTRRYPTATEPHTSPFDFEPQLAQASGVATWDDQSLVSQAARETLKEAASITVPRAKFVLSMLASYILVLVPLNWIICRTMGRVELAWLTAPVIALVFGVLVVRMAQLNIGFDSSATEVGIVELQGDYPRAHVTRYALLYTSLSTDYTIELANPSAVALPFATAANPFVRPGRVAATLRQEPSTGASDVAPLELQGLAVSSNATGMIHTEEMYPLDGSLRLIRAGDASTFQLQNGTGLRLHDAVIVENRELRSRLGTIEPGAETAVKLASRAVVAEQDAARRETVENGGDATLRPIELAELMNVARRTAGADELCLVAWTDDELPGMKIKPAPTQTRRAALVVAHLSYGSPPPIQMDFNSRAQVSTGKEDEIPNDVNALSGDPNDAMPDATQPSDTQPAGQP